MMCVTGSRITTTPARLLVARQEWCAPGTFRCRSAGNDPAPHVVELPPKEAKMTDHKKKGDFDQWQREDKGGDKKQRDNRNEDSRTGSQNSGHGGHK
jgi:hypothetical protein